MKRDKVYRLIDGERDYQNARHSNEQDAKTPVAAWLLYIESHLNAAKYDIYMLHPDGALQEVRKIAALAVACMEHNDTDPRTP